MSKKKSAKTNCGAPSGLCREVLNALQTQVLVCTWPERPLENSRWVFVNKSRAKAMGLTPDDIMPTRPIDLISRESIAKIPEMMKQLLEKGECTVETMTVNKRNGRAEPIESHCMLVESDGKKFVVAENHDISQRNELKARLKEEQEHSRKTLELIEQQKEQLRTNIEENLQLAVGPLLGRLKTSVPEDLVPLVDLLTKRIEHVADELGANRHVKLRSRNLTGRQMLICEMISDGLTSKEIAAALGSSPRTIDNHRQAIRRKLGLKGRDHTLETYLQHVGVLEETSASRQKE